MHYLEFALPRTQLSSFYFQSRNSPTHLGRVEELAVMPEVDNATHPLGRFISRKVKPALEFVGSKRYQRIFGIGSGAYFVITTGPKRLSNLKEKTEDAGAAGRFYFTTYEQIGEGVLTSPIWQMAGSDEILTIKDMPLQPRLRTAVQHTAQRQIPVPRIAV